MTKDSSKGYVAYALVAMTLSDEEKINIIGKVGVMLSKLYPNTVGKKLVSDDCISENTCEEIATLALEEIGYSKDNIATFQENLTEAFETYSDKEAELYFSRDSYLPVFEEELEDYDESED